MIFFKKRKEYNMNEFLRLVEKEAGKLGVDFMTVKVEITRYAKNDYRLEFECYLDKHGFHKGETIYECLEALRRGVKPEKKKTKKVPKIKVKI